ncbi:MAG: hypothetical protein RLY58_2364 [Pseudomonadota bacterium]|jgi:TRAP-type C4-dicarboxylate transport system permease large subunit
MQVNDTTKRPSGPLNRTWSEWTTTLPVFLLLILTLVIGTGEMIHGQLLRTGEKLFGDPATGIQYSMLRADPAKPDCDRHPNLDVLVQQQMAAPADDDFGGLFASEKQDPAQIRQALQAAQQLCEEKYKFFEMANAHITPAVKAFRAFEESFFFIFHFGTDNRALLLVLMVAIAAITTTLGRHHIALRPPTTQVDFKVYSVAMLIANSILVFSAVAYLMSEMRSGIAMDPVSEKIAYVWIVAFAGLTGISIFQMLKPPTDAKVGGSVGMAILSIPLYAWMAVTAASVFFGQQYWSGITIYLGQMVDYSAIFLNLTLYIWVGMLLKQTRVVDMFLNIIRPWNFAPETLTWIILLAAALPTAYTGASGIFVIAAGAIIYKEVLASGARRQYALAATAMSGSLGVVLRPCLLIILITAMNKEVTTDQLYANGLHVFLLTSTLFLIVSLFFAEKKFRIAPLSIALPQSARALVPAAPYVIIMLAVVWFYKIVLDTKLDEYTASTILPFVMLAIVFFDKIRREPAPTNATNPTALHPNTDHVADHVDPEHIQAHAVAEPVGAERRIGFEAAIRLATNETIGHIGALLMLMALSMSMGGVIERSGVMHLFPHEFSSVIIAMAFLMVTKVIIGMIMDPFGAVVLVSASLAPIAYHNGIDPVHFWMMVLTAFELGYLLPPVALNQLLTRQVVGEKIIEEADASVRHLSFYYRYERWILPLIVMTIGLLVVSFGPFFFDWGFYPSK